MVVERSRVRFLPYNHLLSKEPTTQTFSLTALEQSKRALAKLLGDPERLK